MWWIGKCFPFLRRAETDISLLIKVNKDDIIIDLTSLPIILITISTFYQPSLELMSMKKSHEVQVLADVISTATSLVGVTQVIDLGSGKVQSCACWYL